jgi:hypothetical protein
MTPDLEVPTPERDAERAVLAANADWAGADAATLFALLAAELPMRRRTARGRAPRGEWRARGVAAAFRRRVTAVQQHTSRRRAAGRARVHA